MKILGNKLFFRCKFENLGVNFSVSVRYSVFRCSPATQVIRELSLAGGDDCLVAVLGAAKCNYYRLREIFGANEFKDTNNLT